MGLAFLPELRLRHQRARLCKRDAQRPTTNNNNDNTSTSTSTATTTTTTKPGDGSHGGGVYGVLYRPASPAEERRLDGYEGVPWAYEDLVLDVERLSSSGGGIPVTPPGAEGGDSSSSDKPVPETTAVRASGRPGPRGACRAGTCGT